MVQKEEDFGPRIFEWRQWSWWYYLQSRNTCDDRWASNQKLSSNIVCRANMCCQLSISLAWSLRITGITCFTANLCATLLVRDRNSSVKPSQVGFATYLLRRYEVILLLLYSFVNMLGYMILLYSLSNYAVSIGLSQAQASNITAILNLGTAIGRPVIGFASDRLGRILVAGSLAMFTGVCCFCIWIPSNSYGVLIFYALVAGATIGTFWMVSTASAKTSLSQPILTILFRR